MNAMRISELAQAGGVGVETVRFYQRKGLLTFPRGDAPAGRHYDEEDLRRLRWRRFNHWQRNAEVTRPGGDQRRIGEQIEGRQAGGAAR